MGDLSQMTGGPVRTGAMPPNVRGKIARAPAGQSEPMTIVLENYSRDWDFEIPADHWSSNGVLPVAGDSVLVSFDDEGDAWVTVFAPELPDLAAGQGLVWNGSGWDATNVATQAELDAHAALTGTAHIAPIASSLPGSPVDGQVVRLQNTAMGALGVVWTMRYRAASPNAEKWEFLGSASLSGTFGGQVFNPIGGGLQDGPLSTLVVPFTGWYECEGNVNGTGSAQAYWDVHDGVNAVTLGQIVTQAGQPSVGAGKGGFVFFTAGNTLRVRFAWPGFGGSWTVNFGVLFIRPLRLA